MTIELTQSPAAAPPRPHRRPRLTFPATPGTTPRGLPWNVAVDQRPAAVAFPRDRRRGRRGRPRRRRAGLRVAPQSTGHNAGPLAARGLDDVVVVRTVGDDHRHRRPGPRHRPRRGRRRLGARRRRRRRPRPGRPARLLPRRRHRRLLPRRRHRLVRPQARPGHQQPHRRRARDRATAPWSAPTRPPTPSSSGRCAAAAAASASSPRWSSACTPSQTAYAGMLRLGRRRRRAGAARVGRLGPGRARRGHHVVPGAADLPPMPELPDVPAGPPGRRHRRRGARLRRARPRRCSRGLRALRPELDTFARVPAKALVRLHMDPEGGAPVRLRLGRCSARSPTRRSTRSSTEARARRHHLAAAGRAAPARRGAGPPAPGRRGAVAPRRRSSSPSPARSRRPRRWAPQGHADAARLTEALAPWANGRQYLNFAETPVDPEGGVRRGRVAPAHGHPRPRSTRTGSFAGQPPGAAPVRGRASHRLTTAQSAPVSRTLAPTRRLSAGCGSSRRRAVPPRATTGTPSARTGSWPARPHRPASSS